MGLSRTKAFLDGCGYIGLVVTVNKDGTASGVTAPEGERVDNDAIQSAFKAAGLTPEVGKYTFELYDRGTALVIAPSQGACDTRAALETAFDARITQPLLARLRGAQASALPSDTGGGMHGADLHGSPTV